MRQTTLMLLRYYAALRLAAGSMLDIVPAGIISEVPPIVRRSANELSSGFDRRELVEVGGRTHVITLGGVSGRRDADFSPN